MPPHLSIPWQIPGADGRPIFGDTHLPEGAPAPAAPPAKCHVLLAHGLMGYKDYGFFPHLAVALARAGHTAHRFNFSHSGVTRNFATFERPDLFERDSWRKQVYDLLALIDAAASGRLPGAPSPSSPPSPHTSPAAHRPIVLLGHSRGGVSCILAAGSRSRDNITPLPAALITIAAPARCDCITDEERAGALSRGFFERTSSRTGQVLRTSAAWLREQLDDPAAHDLPAHAAAVGCPWLILHGDADASVSPENARRLAAANSASPTRPRLVLLPGTDHVINTPNPYPATAPAPPRLARAESAILGFLYTVLLPNGAGPES